MAECDREKEVQQQKVKFLSINTCMIPAKLVYILSNGAIGSYVPYLNLFLISIGLTTSQAGIISGVRFLSAPFSTAFFGTLIDYTGRRKTIFLILCLGASLPIFGMPWVAHALSERHSNATIEPFDNAAGMTYADFSHKHLSAISKYLFYVILGMLVVAGIFSVPLAGFTDSVVMNVIKTGKKKTSYGAQRMAGSISFGLFNFLAGVAADHYAKSRPSLSHYTPIFYLFIVQMLLLIPVGFLLLRQANWECVPPRNGEEDVSTKDENASGRAFFCSLFKSVKSVIFLITVFISGISYNLFFGYVFLFMRDEMGVSDTMMTLTVVCSTLSEIITFPFTSKLIRFIGDTTLAIIIGIFSYFVRFVVMSYFSTMWIIIPIQLLHGLGFSLSWAAQMEYVHVNTPSGSRVKMFSILTSLHFAVGAVIANVVGGELYSLYGGRKLFLGIGVICVAWTGLMIMFYNMKKFSGLTATFEVDHSIEDGRGGGSVGSQTNRNPKMVRGAAYTIRYPDTIRNATGTIRKV